MSKAQELKPELLPCPLCGGQAELRFNDFYRDMSMVACKCCGATAHASKWNNRAPASSEQQAAQQDAYVRHAVMAERERICASIKAEDDYCVTQGDYMLDSDDCIKVARGEWARPVYDAARASNGGKA